MVCEKCKKDNVEYNEYEFDWYNVQDNLENDEPMPTCSCCGYEFADNDIVYVEKGE